MRILFYQNTLRFYETFEQWTNFHSYYFWSYIGGFTRKMRVCKLRHSSSGQDMYILTVENCENFAATGRIGEEFNFYVSNSERSRYSTSRYWDHSKTLLLFCNITCISGWIEIKIPLQVWISTNLHWLLCCEG